MIHFNGYEGTPYNECVNHSNRIQIHFQERKLSKNMSTEQDLLVVYATILELYDQVVPISLGKLLPCKEEQRKYIVALADRIAKLPFCKNLLQEGAKQLRETELADKFSSKKILHVYWLGYQNIFDDPLHGEELGSIGSQRFRENLRKILNALEQGFEIELWISDWKTLYRLAES